MGIGLMRFLGPPSVNSSYIILQVVLVLLLQGRGTYSHSDVYSGIYFVSVDLHSLHSGSVVPSSRSLSGGNRFPAREFTYLLPLRSLSSPASVI
ncbi:unnamed protein product [Calypogeia fissa]